MTECTCGASIDGKWADVHDARCPAVAHVKTDEQAIDGAWERHKAARAPDWPPAGSAIGLPDGARGRGSTGQTWEVKNGQWVRLF